MQSANISIDAVCLTTLLLCASCDVSDTPITIPMGSAPSCDDQGVKSLVYQVTLLSHKVGEK